MLPVQYQVGPECTVKDVTNGALQICYPIKREGILFYKLQLNGAFVLFKPNWVFLIGAVRKITLRQDGDLFIAKIKFNGNKVDVIRIDPATRIIKSAKL